MSETPDHSDDRALAGEYVLGLMEPAAARDFAARLEHEPELAGLVRDWQEELAVLADEVTPVVPREQVKHKLDERLFGAEQKARPVWSLRRAVAGFALAAALVIGILVVQPDAQPDFRAEVTSEDASFVLVAAYFEEAGYLQLEQRAGRAREGRSLELWLIEGENPPVSLGVIAQTEQSILTLPEDRRGRLASAVLAGSDEPEGGSPTGAPTGDVLATGLVSKV